jgi:hypothetical protein
VRIALLAALLVACGSEHPGSHDAGRGDAGGDDSDANDAPIDADPNVRGTVTVHLVDKNGAALAGMYVVFIDRDATVTERMTDAAGMAQADVYPNASVTAIRVRGMSYSLATVQALVPGDAITLVSAASDVSSSEDPFSSRIVPLPGANIVASPNGASKSGALGTFTTVAPHGLVAGDQVIVANVGVAGYNGMWTVALNPAPTATTFSVNLGNTTNLANSGTVATGGATATKAIAFTVSYTAYAGAEHYEIHTRCGTLDVPPVTAARLVMPFSCGSGGQYIEILAKTNAGSTLAWTQQAVVVTPEGSATVQDTWHAPTLLTASYANPTAQVSDITLARFSPYVRGLPYVETTSSTSATTTLMAYVSNPSQAAIVTSLTCPNGASSGCISTASGAASQRITQVVNGGVSTYALDIAANALPWVKATYVPATTTLDIMATGSSAIDIFEGNLRYTRGQVIYTWRVFGPLAQSVQFPTLPATAPGNPTVSPSDIMSSYQAFVGESDAINGYRDAIKNPFEALGTCEASSNATIKPYAGTKNRISQWN